MRMILHTAMAALAALIVAGCATPERPASGTVYVITTVELNPGRQADFVEVYNIYAPQILAQTGCLEYLLDTERFATEDGPVETLVAILEKWNSLDAVRAHRDSALLARFEADSADMAVKFSRLIMQQE